ncbi:TPA: hypothetical protein G8C86_004556, partial [Salmonella enterica]|nr:hypothetical protein [Salmonella enterica]
MLAFGTQAEADIAAQQDTLSVGIALDTFEKIRQADCRAGGTWDFGLQTEIGSENLLATRRQNSGVL